MGYEVRTVGQYGVVENVRGTSSATPPEGCESWIDFWKKHTGLDIPSICQNDLCEHTREEQEIVGAHVRFFLEDDIWIVPLCAACNAAGPGQMILLPSGTKAVKVDAAKKEP